MSKRVGWLFFWTTLTFWVGCSNAPRSGEAELGAEADAYHQALHGDAIAPGGRGRAGEPRESAEAVDEDLGVSVTGLERTHWRPIATGPTRGLVPHHPHYFDTDCAQLTADRPNPLASDSIEARAEAVTARSRAPFDATVLAETPLMMGKYAADLVILPARVVMDPPTNVHYSPQ